VSTVTNGIPSFVRQNLAALRALVVFTVIVILYAVVVTVIAQIPGLKSKADGSLISSNGHVVGSALIGQLFSDSKGNPLPQYFQPRPSAAGAGYDPTLSGGANLGPESILDVLPNPQVKGDTGKPSLLTQVCTTSMQVGQFNGVNGQRTYCTSGGVGAVLSVIYSHGLTGAITQVVSANQECPATPFIATYLGQQVHCASFGVNYNAGRLVPIAGPGRGASNPVPPDAVTTSASGLDPAISIAYANLQAARVAKTRGMSLGTVRQLIAQNTVGRDLGFMGEAYVNVLQLNIALDQARP
jgi:potassium-transporting ATPase KdpC subunit